MNKRSIKNTNRLLLFVWMSFCLLSHGYSQKKYSITKKYAPSALSEDTRIIKDVVLKMHPVIGIYKPRSYYETLFDKMIAGLTDSLTEKQYRIRLKLLFNELHCGHSEVMYSKAYTRAVRPMQLNFLPYYVITVNNKLFVGLAVKEKKDSLLKAGAEVLKINNIGIDSILNYTSKFFTSDGNIASGKNLYMRSGFNYYYPSLFGRPDSFFVQFKQNGEIKEAWLKASKLKDLPVLPIRPKEDSTWKRYRKANINVGYLDTDRSTYVMKIRSFKSAHYKKVYRRTFRKLEREQIPNFVIDLRNNGGGNLMNSYKLLSYLLDSTESITLKTHVKDYPLKKYTRGNLGFKITRLCLGIVGTKRTIRDTVFYTQKIKPRKKHHYNGNLYVLINGGTFSASCIVSAYLKENGKGTFIGSETSGAKEGCNAGVTPYYILPHTKLQVRIPAFRIIHDVNPAVTARGILPDHEVNYEIQNILNREDLELQKLRDLLKTVSVKR
jgi:hypothetical protein